MQSRFRHASGFFLTVFTLVVAAPVVAAPVVAAPVVAAPVVAAPVVAAPVVAAPVVPSPWSWGPSVAAAVGALNLQDGSFSVGPNAIPLGACLGLTYLPIDAGVDGCFNFVLASKNAPNTYFPSLMIHLKKYFQGGVGLLVRPKSDDSGLYYNILILLGGRYGFAGG